MAFTLAEIKTKVRERANMENSSFVSDDELKGYINSSYAELIDILVSRFEDYRIKTFQFSLNSTNTQAIPADFYKLRGLDFQHSPGRWVTLRKFNFQDRNRLYRGRKYRVIGTTLYILPAEQAVGNYQLWYVDRFVPLDLDTDEMDDVLDFEEYVVVDAAIKCLAKEESDTAHLDAEKMMLKQRIQAMASNRDNEPERITDVRNVRTEDDDWSFWGV